VIPKVSVDAANDLATKHATVAQAQATIARLEPLVMWLCLIVYIEFDPADKEAKQKLGPLFGLCWAGVMFLIGQYTAAEDPPSADVLEVALPTFAVPSGRFRCATNVTAARCAALNTAYARFRTALIASTTASAGMAFTMERLTGALQADSAEGRLIQAGAEKAYAGQLATALTAQATAGRALAGLLRATKLDARMDATSRRKLLAQLGSPNGQPGPVVSRVVGSGLIKSAAELSKILRTIFAGKPTPSTLASTLATPIPTAGLVQLSKQLTVYEAAAILRALANQRAITGGTRDALLDDLREVATASNGTAREAALGRFDLDVGGVSGPAGALLAAAAQAL
jgi:hypothetical protein